jgi:hypothetical protein
VIGVTSAVASGLVEVNANNFQKLRREVRRELRVYRIRLQPAGTDRYQLVSRGKKSGHRVRTFLGRGSFVMCCRIVVGKLAPSNPER